MSIALMADQAQRQRLADRLREHRGAVSLYVTMIIVAFFLMVVLITDGAALRGQRRTAGDIAQRAGRIATQEIDVAATISGGGTVLDGPDAIEAARVYIESNGGTASAVLRGDNELVVTVTMTVRLPFSRVDREVSATRVVGAESS